MGIVEGGEGFRRHTKSGCIWKDDAGRKGFVCDGPIYLLTLSAEQPVPEWIEELLRSSNEDRVDRSHPNLQIAFAAGTSKSRRCYWGWG